MTSWAWHSASQQYSSAGHSLAERRWLWGGDGPEHPAGEFGPGRRTLLSPGEAKPRFPIRQNRSPRTGDTLGIRTDGVRTAASRQGGRRPRRTPRPGFQRPRLMIESALKRGQSTAPVGARPAVRRIGRGTGRRANRSWAVVTDALIYTFILKIYTVSCQRDLARILVSTLTFSFLDPAAPAPTDSPDRSRSPAPHSGCGPR